jgi:clan AA aspartic protease
MGILFVDGTIASTAAPRRKRTLRFLVDTGAFYTTVPRDVLAALGVRPIRRETFEFADGRRARWQVGEARVAVNDREATRLVAFGKPGTQPLLGADTLEGLALTVDPRRRRLVPMAVLPLAAAGRRPAKPAGSGPRISCSVTEIPLQPDPHVPSPHEEGRGRTLSLQGEGG